jgi:hypothetical protein
LINEISVTDVSVDELDSIAEHRLNRLLVSGIGEGVKHSDVKIGVAHYMVNEVRPDEPRASRDKQPGH